MRIKLLLVALLVASNATWFEVYRIMDKTLAQEIVLWHQVEKDRDFFQDQAVRLFPCGK